ncbi:MAG: protein jag [Candidatus Bipolaricaulaceae bacterium]
MEERVREALVRFFSGLLEVLGEEGKVEVWEEGGAIFVNLRGRFKGLAPEDGELRGALARLASLHLKIALREAQSVEVDINGEEQARRKKLLAHALALAEKVRAEKRPVELEPMPPKDRRLIHLALANFPGVRTYSVGKGSDRRVVIAPEEPSGS